MSIFFWEIALYSLAGPGLGTALGRASSPARDPKPKFTSKFKDLSRLRLITLLQSLPSLTEIHWEGGGNTQIEATGGLDRNNPSPSGHLDASGDAKTKAVCVVRGWG
jgi:hypothetical protein